MDGVLATCEYFLGYTAYMTKQSKQRRKASANRYYIPSTGLSYHAGLMEIFFEAGLFHEIAIAKYLHSVPYLRFETSRYDYLYGKGGRNAWHKNYNDNLIMMHPIKLSLLHNFKERKLFCDTVVAAFFRNLMDISYFEARRENRI
ncbi:hypothetical protein RB195_013087 [Necator americanus]|uniref:Uncharacterized protein n=1 Tax=Necator americanus TaxID=51031 RepID=A0ABR1DTX0_NECAM